MPDLILAKIIKLMVWNNDVVKLLEINKSLQNEITTVRQFKDTTEQKIKSDYDQKVDEIGKELTIVTSEKQKAEAQLKILRQEYSELESEFIMYK